MPAAPLGVVTIRSVKWAEPMFSSAEQLHDGDTHVCTWIGNGCPAASQWRLVRHGEAYCIQNVATRQWMYADKEKRDEDRRWVLTRKHSEVPLENLAYHWHLVPHGAAFGLKSAKHDEWLFANIPKLSEQCRHVLTCVNGDSSPKKSPHMLWAIEAPPINAPKAHVIGRTALVESAGFEAGITRFCLDGENLAFVPKRGLNVAVLEPQGLQVLTTHSYDVLAEHGERNQFVADVEAIPEGHVVLVALMDSGMDALDLSHWMVLHKLGAEFSKGEYREGYALIGVKGGRALAEAQGKSARVTATLSPRAATAQDAQEKQRQDGTDGFDVVPLGKAQSD